MGSYQMGFKHPFVGKTPSKTAKQTIKHLPCPFLPAHCAQQRGDNGETRRILLLHSRQPHFSPSLCPKTSGKHQLHPRAEGLGNLLSPTPADLSPLPASSNLHKCHHLPAHSSAQPRLSTLQPLVSPEDDLKVRKRHTEHSCLFCSSSGSVPCTTSTALNIFLGNQTSNPNKTLPRAQPVTWARAHQQVTHPG